MARHLFSLAFVVALSAIQVDAIPKLSTVDLSCHGAVSVIEYPNQRISDGTLVFNATEVTPADAIVYLRICESDQGPVITIDGSDPSSWLVTLPGQCAHIWVNDTSTSVGCKKTAVIVEASQVSEHCDEDPWAEICNPLPDPTPSSAVPLTLARAAVITVAVFVTNAAF